MTQSLVPADLPVSGAGGRLVPAGQPGIQTAAAMMLARSVLVGRLLTGFGYAALMLALHGVADAQLQRYAVPFAVTAVLTAVEFGLLTRIASGGPRLLLILLDTVVAVVILLIWTADPVGVLAQVSSAALAGTLLGVQGIPLWLGQAVQATVTCCVVLADKVAPASTTVLLVTAPALIVAAGAAAVTVTHLVQARLLRESAPTAPVSEIHTRLARTLRRAGTGRLRLPIPRTRRCLDQELADELTRDTLRAMDRAAVPVHGIRFDLAEPDFADAIGQLCRDWADSTRLQVHTELHPVWLHVPARHQLALIVEDALSNISGHARATRAQIEINERRQQVTLTVRDNGQGFTFPARAQTLHDGRHQGLCRMIARSAYLGADLSITTAPYAGTEIQVRMQLGDSA